MQLWSQRCVHEYKQHQIPQYIAHCTITGCCMSTCADTATEHDAFIIFKALLLTMKTTNTFTQEPVQYKAQP